MANLLKISKRKYFGTDGIRGSISKETNPEFILKLGWAAGSIFKKEGINTLIIGKDTRISGYMLETALQAGIIAAGVNVRLVGPMPTPAISYLANSFKKQAGIVISASHNSYEDNGIKFFGDDGKKISDSLEQKIEQKLAEDMIVVEAKYLGKAERISDANGRYIEFCKSSLKRDINFSSLKIVLDVANGAAYDVAPKVFRELGAELIVIADKPDGMNINKDCGSTNIELLKNEVKKHAADFGLALDGDGDRLIFVDENSEKLDGDEVLFILARDKFENQITLGPKGVVGTTMTNKGLELALKEFGIDLIRADVGDRHVLQKLEELEWELGGEQSGHIMCLDIANTGDAIVSSIKFLEAILCSNKSLKQLLKPFKKYPQILTKIKSSNPDKILSNNKFVSLYENFLEEIKLKDGRINIRKSGTESAIRIMVEGIDENQTKEISNQLTKAAQEIA